ncbi:hypothetical protein EXIGLDRAFT_721090 [Exidia glandulosa HHB12029]|uniref:Uncharacterized protein n=1 Tax=Exidia glandulosa HHB12029 TaxID=1314781 RepID=A0A165FYP5_EXIGL|nr:hypothetical protein EXIGLDRAFT_721090 [Exidia glandulosa HHB12029]
MTTVLSRTRDGHSLPAALHPKRDKNTLLQLRGASRFSTLLTAGDSRDPSNAVTGHFSPSPVPKGAVVLEAAIVSRNTSPGATDGAIPYDLEPITPGDDKAALGLLVKWADTRHREFEEHLRDVVTVVKYIARTHIAFFLAGDKDSLCSNSTCLS